ncbi:MAG: AMP-binding protein, partial [Planctomycetia bacterium]
PAPGAILLEELLAAPPIAPVRTAPDPIGLILYTSGTTSRPKGVAHSQRRMAHRVDLFVDELGLTASDSTLVAAFAGRPALLLGQILPMLRVGGRLDLLSAPDPVAFWAKYAATRPTYMLTSPGMAIDFVDHPAAAAADHARLRYWITGGDKVPPLLHRRTAEVVGRPLLEMCGMTEAGFYAINPPTGPIKVGSIGLAMRGVAVRLTAPDGSDVPPGEVGHVVVRTPDLMVGYWNDTLQTHRVLRNGWLDTGDLARADDNGYLWFVGRDKDMIVRGGAKVAPAMVEEALTAHPAVAAAAVVARSDARYGQLPFGFYSLRDGQSDPGPEALTDWLAARLDA